MEINNYDDRELHDDFLLLGGSRNDVSRRKEEKKGRRGCLFLICLYFY